MATTQPHRQERTARVSFNQCPVLVSVNGAGAVHYWGSYEQAVIVVKGDDAEKGKLTGTPLATLGEWCEYIYDDRSLDTKLLVGGLPVDSLGQVVYV